MRVASPDRVAAELAESHARALWYAAANDLDESRHQLLAASLAPLDAEERLRRRSIMHDAVMTYWTALETYVRARGHLNSFDAGEGR